MITWAMPSEMVREAISDYNARYSTETLEDILKRVAEAVLYLCHILLPNLGQHILENLFSDSSLRRKGCGTHLCNTSLKQACYGKMKHWAGLHGPRT